MTKISLHETTRQVIEMPPVEPNLFEVLGERFELSIMNTSGWWVCEQDPRYRRMPPSIGGDA